jgi:hypothetical protein
MNGPLSVATIVLSLVLAGWYLLRAVLNRPPGRLDLAAAGVLAVVVLVLAAVATWQLVDGRRPTDTTIFVGYLITTVAVPPTGWQLARMEPTRWGSVILTVTCLTVPALVLRLQQIWAA